MSVAPNGFIRLDMDTMPSMCRAHFSSMAEPFAIVYAVTARESVVCGFDINYETLQSLTAQLQFGRRLDLLPFVGHKALVHALVLFLHLFDEQAGRIAQQLKQ